jgi:serine/threonine protein kinase
VQYHDRYVDRDAGMLYILMEYCGGGDLSAVIKQAQKHNHMIPEETIWHYFMQILLALHYCHHPNSSSWSGSSAGDGESKERRAPILHRDLKPDNGAFGTILTSAFVNHLCRSVPRREQLGKTGRLWLIQGANASKSCEYLRRRTQFFHFLLVFA